MKKGIALILTAALLLTGCGGASAQTNTQEKTDAAQEEAVVTEEAPANEAEKTKHKSPLLQQKTRLQRLLRKPPPLLPTLWSSISPALENSMWLASLTRATPPS